MGYAPVECVYTFGCSCDSSSKVIHTMRKIKLHSTGVGHIHIPFAAPTDRRTRRAPIPRMIAEYMQQLGYERIEV